MNDIEIMLNKSVQDYYGNEYLNYQKNAIERNDKFLKDRAMISKFVLETNIQGNIIDIGSGACQWFHLFEQKVNHYFAIETNSIALSLAPNNSKLTKINQDIFDKQFDLQIALRNKIELAFFSFFLSHFSDTSIQMVLEKLTNVNSLLIIDSFWSDEHKGKYQTKNLKEVKRKISEKEHINLPKRFFDYQDIENLAKPLGYSITKFTEGNFWFVCLAQK